MVLKPEQTHGLGLIAEGNKPLGLSSCIEITPGGGGGSCSIVYSNAFMASGFCSTVSIKVL